VAGAALAVIGAAGLASEITRTRTGSLGDTGAGATLLVTATALALLVRAWEAPSPINGSIRAAVAFCVFWGMFGVVRGIARSIDKRHTRGLPRITKTEATTATVAAVLGLATAALNLYAAFEAAP
jgi:hypothetical protein